MTPLSVTEQRLIRSSFESLEEYSLSLVKLFYGRMFQLAPHLRPLFRGDLGAQSQKLLDMLVLIVDAMDQPEKLRSTLEELGRRHVNYGAKPEDYETLKSALLWSMVNALDEEFDKETRAAWSNLLGQVTSAMLDGARQAH